MNLDDLGRVDLRLLVAFNALMEERSVSRAAERLDLSQPAMSRNLARLRQLFADELFVRQSHGLAPSPRAEQLHQMMRPVLDDMVRLVAPVKVDPSRMQRTFRVGMLDLFSQMIITPLIRELQANAPHVQLKIVNLETYSMEDLASGQLDLIIHLGDDAPANIHSRVLCYEEPVCMVRKSHPLAHQSLTQEVFARLSFVDFWVPGFNEQRQLDRFLFGDNTDHHIVLETNNLMTAMNTICETDLAMISGERVFSALPRASELVALPLAFSQLDPVPVRLCWHKRYHADAEHQWLREQVAELFQPIIGG